MRKNVLLILIVLFYSLVYALNARAQDPSSATAAAASPAISAQGIDKSPVYQMDARDMEKIMQKGEAVLKKVKVVHRHQEQKKHIQKTEKAYQEALRLYRQKRSALAREALVKVEDFMADYKSTDRVLKHIQNQSVKKLHLEMRRIKQIQKVPVVNAFSQEASLLYQQAANLGDEEKFVTLRNKMARVMQVLTDLRHKEERKAKQAMVELDAQRQLDNIAQKADHFDQDVSRSIKEGNYAAAQAKFDEFQDTMAEELNNVKASLEVRGVLNDTVKKKGGVFDESGYRHLEEKFFRQGIELYRSKNYAAARIIFNELAYQGNKRAKAYLEKTDRLIEEEK